MGVEREQKGCPSFGVYFGGGMSLWGQREQEIRVRKLPFDLWPEVFILKRRGREFGRDFHMVKTSISHPLFMFFFLCNRSLKCQRHQCTQVKKTTFPSLPCSVEWPVRSRRLGTALRKLFKRLLSYPERRHPFVLPLLPLSSCLKCRHDDWSPSGHFGI